MELLFNGYRVSVWNDEVLEMDSGGVNVLNAIKLTLCERVVVYIWTYIHYQM